MNDIKLSARAAALLKEAFQNAISGDREGNAYAGPGTGFRMDDADRLAALGLVTSEPTSTWYWARLGPFGRSGCEKRTYIGRKVKIADAGRALVNAQEAK